MWEDASRGASELKLYRAYFEASPSGIFVYDPNGRLIDVNAAACAMHGCTRDEMLAMSSRDFIAPESYALFEAFQDGWEETGVFCVEVRGLRRDGSRFDAEVEARRITVDGRLYLFTSLIDITERKALADQLRHAQRMEAIGQLAGGIAHDFNNLLTVILGNAEMLMGQIADAGQREDMDAILAAGGRGRDLVQRLLAFSRRQPLDIAATDLNAFVADQADTLKRMLSETLDIRFRPRAEGLVVRIDRGLFQQVLFNLAINAQHAMRRGGRLSFETADARIEEGSTLWNERIAPGHYAILSVADDGEGMDAGVQERIFEPFFTTKGPGEGTGLGLSMVYGIVKQHGGHIHVESEPGRGTRFELYLPIANGRAQPLAGRPTSEVAGGAEHVLVVEDSRPVRELTARVLGELGYHVATASDAAEALEMADATERLDLLVADVVLPGRDGPRVTDSLRRRFPELRVLYLSGYPATLLSQQGVLREGMHLVSKPFTRDELAAAVRGVLDQPSAAASA